MLGNEYRGVVPPSGQHSGAVAQAVAQRAELQESFKYVGTELDRQGFLPHSIACVAIVGLTPSEEGRAQGFEQYRHSLEGVHLVTFDELVKRLQALYGLLASGGYQELTEYDDPKF